MDVVKCICNQELGHPISVTKFGIPTCNFSLVKHMENSLPVDLTAGNPEKSETNFEDIEAGHPDFDNMLKGIITPDNNYLETEIHSEPEELKQVQMDIEPDHIHRVEMKENCALCHMMVDNLKMFSDFNAGAPMQKKKKPVIQKKKPAFTENKLLANQPENMSECTLVKIYGDKIVDVIKHKNGNFKLSDIVSTCYQLNIRCSNTTFQGIVSYVRAVMSKQLKQTPWTHPITQLRNKFEKSDSLKQNLHQMESLVEEINYSNLYMYTKKQSVDFVDVADLNDRYLIFGNSMIHPIIVALFGKKLAGLEEAAVLSDSYYLMKKLLTKEKISNEFMATIMSKIGDEDLVYSSGNKTDLYSMEAEKINIHMVIRAIVQNLRSGNFKLPHNNKLLNYLSKLVAKNTPEFMSTEEHILYMLLHIFGFKSISSKTTKDGISVLKTSPYITIDVSNINDISSPIVINSDYWYNTNYDSFYNRLELKPMTQNVLKNFVGMPPQPTLGETILPNRNYFDNRDLQVFGQPPQMNQYNFVNNNIVANGSLIFYIQREKPHDHGLAETCFMKSSNFSPVSINFEPTIVHNYGSIYEISSAVCYKVNSSLTSLPKIEEDSSSFTIVFTQLGPWVYDPYYNLSRIERDNLFANSLKNMWKMDKDNGEPANVTYSDWKQTPEAMRMIDVKLQEFKEGKRTFEDSLISLEDAYELIRNYAYIIVYSQNYEIYKTNKMQ